MDQDFYKTLEIDRSASQADIQKAYRDLARKYHPDLNPDDKAAKVKFQEVQRAFEVLDDPEKRELYDRYGSSFESGGDPRQGAAGWPPGGAGGMDDIDLGQFFGQKHGSGGASGGFADIFKQFTGAGGASPFEPEPSVRRGEEIRREVRIPFNQAVSGGQVELRIQRASGKVEQLTVKIPAGIEDGKKIRLREQGEMAPRRGKPGDLIITVKVDGHPCYSRRGNRLDVKVPVTLAEAVEGAKIDIPTPSGTVTITIPPGTSSGSKLRLKGCGVSPKSGAPGDLFAEIQIVLPETIDDQSLALVRQFDERNPASPRENLKW